VRLHWVYRNTDEDQKPSSESSLTPESGVWASEDDSWRRPRQCRSVDAASSSESGRPSGNVSHADRVQQSQKISSSASGASVSKIILLIW
jgi:hypothetical protein